MPRVNTGHYLMGCRADTWFRLLRQNGFAVERDRIPQALLISAVSTAMVPAAALEKLLFDKKIRASKPKKDPVFILGHWRSGTTYLQNLLSKDRQFGWFDPVSTVVFPYSILFRRPLTGAVKKGIAGGRPMDNVQYAMDLPMEETFAFLSQNPRDIINLIAFPVHYEQYLSGAFIADLSPEERERWLKDYDYIIRKMTCIAGGKQLVLKSPDNTARVRELRQLYPDARFINIHRDPYSTIRSTVHMFKTQMELLHLSEIPENIDGLIASVVLGIFERMYRELLSVEKELPSDRFVNVAYEDLCAAPVDTLRGVYEQLGLEGFAAAEPAIRAFADSQKSYRKNRLDLAPALVREINDRLDFYFERYGYTKQEAQEP